MGVKSFFTTIGIAILYDLIGCVVYFILMLLFSWMTHWWWFFIILIGIGDLALIIGIAQMYNMLIMPLCKNLFGKILTIFIVIHLAYFSMTALWTTDFNADEAKVLTVQIIATIVFASIYIPAIPVALFYKNDSSKTNEIIDKQESIFVNNELTDDSGCVFKYIEKGEDDTYYFTMAEKGGEPILYNLELDDLKTIGFKLKNNNL